LVVACVFSHKVFFLNSSEGSSGCFA
jgi:hypothetical protein